VQKLEGLGYCTVKIAWSWLQPFSTDPPVWRTDGRTDRRTDGFAIAYSALSMLSRAKNVFSDTSTLAMQRLSGCTNTHYTRPTRHLTAHCTATSLYTQLNAPPYSQPSIINTIETTQTVQISDRCIWILSKAIFPAKITSDTPPKTGASIINHSELLQFDFEDSRFQFQCGGFNVELWPETLKS